MLKLDVTDVYTYDFSEHHRAQIWYKNGLIHRDGDQPAWITEDGECRWYKDGLIHRDNDLPAVVKDNEQEWYSHGVLHRDNGEPAIVSPRYKAWYVNGKRHRDENDLPAEEGPYHKYWLKNGDLHRDTRDPQTGLLLPALIYRADETSCYLNGVQVDEHGKPI
jgi:hypothetical protein